MIVTIIISGIFILLSRVDAVFLFWSLFLVFPRIPTAACVVYSQSNFINSYFLYSPRRQAFLVGFICVFIGCSLGSSFRYSPVFKPFLVNFWFLDFFWLAKIFGNVVSVTYEWKVYILVGHFAKLRERDESKQTTKQRRKKRMKKGEKLEGKGQALLEGRGTIGCCSVVSMIVGVQPLMQ